MGIDLTRIRVVDNVFIFCHKFLYGNLTNIPLAFSIIITKYIKLSVINTDSHAPRDTQINYKLGFLMIFKLLSLYSFHILHH